MRLSRDDYGVRCVRCGASAIHLALGDALRVHAPDLARRDAYELSARGPLVAHLRRVARALTVSEYLPGSNSRGGVRSEDVQRLTFADASFDLVTHTEVLEHVPDDACAFSELQRVLRPGGIMLFTVPLHGGERTVERARLRDGCIEHVLPPAYHRDPLRGGAGILAFRDYGRDILDRLRAAGFDAAEFHDPPLLAPWYVSRTVIVARKANP
ncbi:MAG TPA: methyltransferase domain-containing protein [Rudaea sp.]|nr:methyltransferase domain-containing protein [Rudaea sp.]